MKKINLRSFHALCKSLKNWDHDYVEKRFQGSTKELVEFLNNCEELEIELFFSGFFCDNRVVALASDGDIDIKRLTTLEKIQLYINRGKTLCLLTNNEPSFVVNSCWNDDK